MTMSKSVGVPIFATLLSLLTDEKLNTAQNESYISINKVKYFSLLLPRMKILNFEWYISGDLIIKRSGFICSKCIQAKTDRDLVVTWYQYLILFNKTHRKKMKESCLKVLMQLKLSRKHQHHDHHDHHDHHESCSECERKRRSAKLNWQLRNTISPWV